MRSEMARHVVLEQDALDTNAGFELARQILQATSAIYVIMTASRRPQMTEVSAAMGRVQDWMSELRDLVGALPVPRRAEVQRTLLPLDRAIGAIQVRLIPSLASDASYSDRAASECLARAALSLDRARGGWGEHVRFLATCCAADIQSIPASRHEL